MCLSIIYLLSNGKKEEIMRDVAHLEAEKGGYNLIGLLGEKKFVRGKLKSVDFVPEHLVVIEKA